MEQIAIITKLVQEINEMDCHERDHYQVILNLDIAVRNLTRIVKEIPEQKARDAKWEAGREEREAKEEEKRLVEEKQKAYKKEAQRERRRQLYQLKKNEKKLGKHTLEKKIEVEIQKVAISTLQEQKS